ncbi:MAG: autotransporter outer membrane beta-barrel domain-containing protein [Deltaproteobacteria bacterium]|nr:autotransporter outer membrane beta-barrel domain-containing protein [Deltaproteobacteria bacterium]
MTRNAFLEIGANGGSLTHLDTDSQIFIVGKYEGALAGDQSWFPFSVSPQANERAGGELGMRNNAKLTVSDMMYFGQGSELSMDFYNTTINIGDALYVVGGDHLVFHDVNVGYSPVEKSYRGAYFYGGNITITGNVDVNGPTKFQGALDANINPQVGHSSLFYSAGDFELLGASSGPNAGRAELLLQGQVTIKTPSGVIISSGGGTGEAELYAHNTGVGGDYSTLRAKYIIVNEKGEISIDPNSKLFTDGAFVLIGKYEGNKYEPENGIANSDQLPSGKGLSPGGSLHIDAGGELGVSTVLYVGQGASIAMDPSSKLIVGGGLYTYGGDMVFSELEVGTSALTYGGAHFDGGRIDFTDDVYVNGFTDFQADVVANIGSNVNFTTILDMEIENIAGKSPKVIMGPGSVFNVAVNAHEGLSVGNYEAGGGSAELRVLDNNYVPTTINVGQYIHVTAGGNLIVEDDSTLNVNIADTSSSIYGEGIAAVGLYGGDLPDLLDPETGQPHEADQVINGRGYLIIRENSVVNIDKRFYLGNNGVVDIAPNGRLNIANDFYFKKNGVYKVGATSAADVSLIDIGGTAYISKGAIVDIPTTLFDAVGETFLTAGAYYDDTLPISAFHKIERNGNDLVIGEIGSSDSIKVITDNGHSGGPNIGRASSFLDRVITSPNTSQELLTSLVGYFDEMLTLTESGATADAEKALRQLIGEEALSAGNIASDTVTQVRGALGNRFSAIHANQGSFSPASGNQDYLNRLWAAGFGSWSKQDDHEGLFGYEYDLGGVSLGYDREIDSVPNLTLGLNLALSSGKLKNNDGLSEIKVKTISVGGYGSYSFDNGLYLDASFGFGFSDNDFDSDKIVGGRTKANFDSDSFQVGLDMGYAIPFTESFSLTPSAGLNYVHVKQKRWSERIAFDPRDILVANWFDDSEIDYLEVPVNVKLSGSFQTVGGVTISPKASLGMVLVADKPNRDIRVGFVGSNERFSIRGIDSGKNRFVANAGLKVQANDTLDVFLDYDFESRSSYKSHGAQLGLGVSF